MDVKNGLIDNLVQEGYLKTPRIIDAFRAIDRADFVLSQYSDEAYGNYPLPIGEGQTISQPLTVAFMLELLDPRPGEKILDIGSGSGWTTALLGYIIGEKGRVFGVERMGRLCEFGQKNLAKYFDESRAKITCGNGTEGLPEEAPFDKILAGASASAEIPEEWRKHLKIGGKIVAPVGGSIWCFAKQQATSDKRQEIMWEEKEYPGFVFVPLIREKGEVSKTYEVKTYEVEPHKEFRKPHKSHFWLYPLFSTLSYGLLAVGLVVVLVMGVFANEVYLPHVSYSGSKSVEISPGMGSREIARLLKKEGVIRFKWPLLIYVTLKGAASDLKPGDYVFGKVSIFGIVRDLARGGTNERVITIPEGWNIRDIAIYFESQSMFQQEEFTEMAGLPGVDYSRTKNIPRPKDFSDRFDFLEGKSRRVGLEGYLFPDTYRIFKDAQLEEVVTKMLENFGRKVTPELREEISRQKKTLFEIVTMASLVEKEVAKEEDRPLVAGVLWKRLKLGMALQVDASVNYITGKKTPSISKEDAAIDSPYNTYKYSGLPLGPISNPGFSAIRAAIYPKDSPYLYYLHAPDGRTVFSETLEEHNEAKAKYLTK